jgi:anti-sigma B factor antagonist
MSDKAATSLLTFEVERTGSTAVVRCHGRLVAGDTDRFYGAIKQLIPDSKRIVLDLSDLARVDSIGLGTLVRLYVSAKSAGCSLELIHLGKQIRELLGMTNLLEVFSTIGESGIRMG